MHDYQISWDYMLDDYVEKSDRKLLNKLIKEIKKEILLKLQAFNDFEIFPIILCDSILGIYCSGTYSKPIIGIDIGNIKKACEDYGTNFITALKTTILHELYHGWQEFNGKALNEIDAEDFAFFNT